MIKDLSSPSNNKTDIKIIPSSIEKIYLGLILITAFFVRLIPSRNLSFAGNDAYLHHDIVMRMVEEGFGIISNDPRSLTGLASYGYPPLYHIIGTVLYQIFQTDLVFFLLPPVLGVLSIGVFYKLAQEIFNNQKAALLSTLLFAFIPSFVTRTSVFIPESLGILLSVGILFLVVKYIKSIPGYHNLDNFALKGFLKIFKGDYRYLIGAGILGIFYLFNHRGWVFLVIVLFILIFTFALPSFKKKPVECMGISLLILIMLYVLDVASYFARLQIVPVSVLGFPKWVGLLQLIFGLYGSYVFIKSKNPLYRFLAIWGLLFLLIGSYSFRFRDPYSAIALALMGGYVFSKIILPELNKIIEKYDFSLGKRNLKEGFRFLFIFILVITPVAQGAFSAYSFVVQPSPEEIESFEWIKDNTPVDAVFLTLRDEAYLLIGNTNRRDVLLWKVVYQGFMGEAPSVAETITTHNEVNIIFGTSLPGEAYFLLEKYNVDYIFVGRNMYNAPGSKYGLLNYLPSDTHFKTSYITGDASVYEYVSNPSLESPGNALNITGDNDYSHTLQFIERFWNGYSYSDAGGNYYRNPVIDLEFGGSFKGNYPLNAQISNLFNFISIESSNQEVSDRSTYLLKWLEYKQMPGGAFPSETPPGEYTLGTMETIFPLMEMETAESQKITENGLKFVNEQTGANNIKISPSDDGPGIFEDNYIQLKTNALVSGMYPDNKEAIVQGVLELQESDGSWSSFSYQNIGILKGLCLYYESTGDESVLDSIKKGSLWLKDHQDASGSFEDDGIPQPYGMNHYADAFYIYSVAGDENSAQLTLEYINKLNLSEDINPLKSYLTFYSNLSLIYGEKSALEMASQVI
ncbi:MAG: hypothetical protein CIT03_00970 [Methanobacterium sp.]|nr:MAG: hypothetical protein CIT03_00970 [Methanobacterium sp.]